MAKPGHLSKITADTLGPIWGRRDISITRMAETLGVSHQALSQHARRLGLPSRRGNQDPRKQGSDDLLRRMWEAGVSTTEMAIALGYSSGATISGRARRMGLESRVSETCRVHQYKPAMTLAEFQEIELAAAMKRASEQLRQERR